MTARDEILASVRRSLHVSGDEAPRRAAVAARLAQAPIGIVPTRGQGDAAARIATVKAGAARGAATISEAPPADDVPIEIARWLREGNMPATLRMGADPRLAAMPWAATTIDVSHGPSDGHDLNAVSRPFAAVAETGTLALVSGADNPTPLNFLPDNHIAIVFAQDIVGDFEAVFARLRAAYGAGSAPRTLNFVTGPSRSADIEQTLMFGAHGPRRLHVVVVRDFVPNVERLTPGVG